MLSAPAHVLPVDADRLDGAFRPRIKVQHIQDPLGDDTYRTVRPRAETSAGSETSRKASGAAPPDVNMRITAIAHIALDQTLRVYPLGA